jgi:hypothetical protein
LHDLNGSTDGFFRLQRCIFLGRILRVLRLIRVGRLVISVPELYILLSGLTTSFKPILFGSMMLISVILVWSIIVVELLHPITSGTLGTVNSWVKWGSKF